MSFSGGDEYLLYNTTSPVISFAPEEKARGREELRKMGLGKEDWFIGFHARDNAYLNKWRPQYRDIWSKLDFKNTNIETYLDAASHIAECGGFALRMGAVVEQPLPETVPDRVIDYATCHRSDFMDIYIAAHCRFFLASSTGLGHVPTVFNRPVIVANHFPYNHTHYRSSDLIVPRTILNKASGTAVPFFEAQEAGFFAWSGSASSSGKNSDLYHWGYNDSEDILNGVLDMLDALEGRDAPNGAAEIQDRYAERYLSHLSNYQLGARLSPRYALKYENLI
ncbi:MAG: TIGR04372 family glycosyltransferase [Rhodospirillales bacterium]